MGSEPAIAHGGIVRSVSGGYAEIAVAGHLAAGDPGAAAGAPTGPGVGIAITRLLGSRNHLRIRRGPPGAR